MIDPRNLINLTGGVVTDVELFNDKIGKFRFAVDYAGSEKGSDNTSGYFDIVYYIRDSKGEFIGKKASFIHTQTKADKIKKGTKLQIVGRLVQERWKQDDQNKNRVVVVAEHISYATTSSPAGAAKTTSTVAASSDNQNNVPDSF